MHPSRRRAPNLGVMLLLYQIFGVIGIERIPPVTLSVIALNVAIYLRLFQLPWYQASQVCVSLYNVYYKKDYMRLLYGALEHGDDWHLYYNMLSFVVKGQALERRFGSVKFFYITSVFTVLTSIILVVLSKVASEYDDSFVSQCAIGFSGVIFALKVLTSYYYPNYTHQIMGIPIIMPANYAVWLELVLIQVLIPRASFLGHLAGIIVGLAYVKGPLGWLMDTLYSVVESFVNPPPPRFIPRAESSGYRSDSVYRNFVPPDLSEEEQLRQATEQSLHENFPSSSSDQYSTLYPDLETLRNRRVAHYWS